MLLVPPNSHPHSTSHTGPSCVDQANNHSSSSSSPSHPSPPSPPVVVKQQPHSPPQSPGPNTSSTDHPATAVPNGQPQPHMSGLSEAHYPPVSTATASSQPVVTGRSPQAPPAPLSAPGTPAPTTPTPAPVTTRPSSGGSASGGSAPAVTSVSSVGVSVAGGLISSAGGGGAVTTGSGGTGGSNTPGGLPSAMPVPGPSVTPSGGSSGQLPQHHPLLGYVPHGSNKILSRNINGTRESGGSVGDKKNAMVAVTSNPSNESELQLYRVLQRANLLNYYDTFISQGGDDVQQLCEAGEEEFLEIMALVGMASKPLHVRRLQKALQEWVSNPDSARTMIPAEAMKQRELYSSISSSPGTAWGSSMPTTNHRPTAPPYHNQNEGLFRMPLKSPAPAPTSGMPPQLDAFNILSSLTTTYHQHHQQPQSSNITQSPRGARIPPVAAAAAAAVAAATAPHTAPYQRPQPYPSPENLTARKSPPTGGVAPQPGSVSPTDYRRVLEAAWALRAAGQQDPRSSPPGGKISPPGAINNRSTWPSSMSPPSASSNRSPGHHTDNLHNSSESQPFLPGTPVPWFPFLVPVNKL